MNDQVVLEEQVKEVYGLFGLAIYWTQVLEHTIVNLLIVSTLMPEYYQNQYSPEEWFRAFDSFFEKEFKNTLGKMINNLKKSSDYNCELDDRLLEVLNIRNRLVHRYFRERAIDFLSSEGRDKMIEELTDSICLFKSTDLLLNGVMNKIRRSFGISDSSFKEEMDRFMKEAGVEII